MKDIILTNSQERSFNNLLSELSEDADKIKIVTAFFSDTAFINNWLENSKIVDLLVSLRPPTNYYSLKTIYPKLGINIQFLGNELHSKFYIFCKENKPFACLVGSSNFTLR